MLPTEDCAYIVHIETRAELFSYRIVTQILVCFSEIGKLKNAQ